MPGAGWTQKLTNQQRQVKETECTDHPAKHRCIEDHRHTGWNEENKTGPSFRPGKQQQQQPNVGQIGGIDDHGDDPNGAHNEHLTRFRHRKG